MYTRSVLVLIGLALVAAASQSVPAQQADAFAQADCEREFVALRTELDKRGQALQKAGESKAGPAVGCRLLRSYTVQEARLIEFFTERQQTCQIPPEVIQQAREGHSKAIAMRNNVCQAAAAAKAPPPPPPSAGLSGAIGGGAIGGPPAGSGSGGGAFDTLTGNILTRP